MTIKRIAAGLLSLLLGIALSSVSLAGDEEDAKQVPEQPESVDGSGVESVDGSGIDSVDGSGIDSVDGSGAPDEAEEPVEEEPKEEE